MNKSVPLYPKYIQESVGMDGVVGNGEGIGGEDFRTVHSSSVMHLGTLAFNTTPLHGLSTACILKNYDITFNQRCGIGTGGPELYWTFYPRVLSGITYGNSLNNGGVRLDNFTAYSLNDTGSVSKTNGGSYLDDDRTRTLYTGSYYNLIGDSERLLGMYLTANNPAGFNYKLYLKNLRATATYEARYYARFYDDDGTQLKVQDVEGGTRATAPNVSRTGYTVAWSCDGKSGTYSASNLPTSEDTDLVFRAVYTPITKQFTVQVPSKGEINVYKAVNNVWQLQQAEPDSGFKYYFFSDGDHIKAEAVGCNELSEDLLVEVTDLQLRPISTTTIIGGSGTSFKVYEANAYTDAYVLLVTPQTHYFTITTSAGTGGTITSTRRVTRTGSTTINVTPTAGYRIASVKVDNVSQTIANDQSFSYTFTNVQADHTVEATFARIQYTITFDLPSGVSVTADETAVSGNALTVNHGDTIEFVFSCGSSMSLTGLFLDSSTDSLMAAVFKQVQSASHTMYYITGAHTLKATATSDLVTIGIVQDSNNPIRYTITGPTGKYIRQVDDSDNKLTFEFAAEAGYGFVEWDDGTTTLPLSFAPTANRNVSVTIEALTYQVSGYVSATKIAFKDGNPNSVERFVGGDISLNGQRGRNVVKYIRSDGSVHVEIIPDPGFSISPSGSYVYLYPNSGVDDGSHGSYMQGSSFDIDNPTSRVSIEHVFRRNVYDVVVTPKEEAKSTDGSCSVNISEESYYGGFTRYFYESELTLTAIPGEGWYFQKWSDGGGAGKNVRTITVPAADVALQAVFAKFQYEQQFSAGEGGKVTIDGEPASGYTAEYGESLLLTFTADIGQKIKDVLLDGVSVFDDVTLTRRGGTYWLTDITAAHSVAVVFAPRIYTNNRKLIDYYPPVIASIVDIQRLMAAYQISIDALWDAVSFLEENQYIETATDEGVSVWERELGIIPGATDTLKQRKARLRLKWVPSNNFTTKWLHDWLEDVCGAEVPWPEVEGYTLKVTLPWFATWWTIFGDLKQYKPANIVLDQSVSLPEEKGNLYAGFAMQTEYEYEVDGETAEPLYEEEYTDAPPAPPGNV